MKYLDIIKNPQLEKTVVTTKLPPPLITLLSEQKPEIQYVALRNINLSVQVNRCHEGKISIKKSTLSKKKEHTDLASRGCHSFLQPC